MTGYLTRWLATCGVSAYPLVLHAYPPAFRREFGDAMSQAFRDQTQEACRRSGLAGLLRLWVATLVDTGASLVANYTRDPNPMFVRVLLGAALYVGVLTVVIGYGAVTFPQFYEPPPFTRWHVAAPQDENALLAGYLQALDGDLGQYRTYVRYASVVLALMLGVVAGLFGVAQRSVWHGAALFAIGVGSTAGLLELMPTIWFPLDRHPVGFLWIMATPIGLCTWTVVAVIGRVPWRGPHLIA